MPEKEDILGKTIHDIDAIMKAVELPGYAAHQLAEWLYKRKAASFDEMTNLSKASREKLNISYFIGLSKPEKEQISSDGTKKYLFKVNQDKFIESVYIPETDRSTLCISTQVGCKMGCIFCMTGKQGFLGNLTTGEILNQIMSLPERDNLTNFVFMGMGEPLANTEIC
jgi:23S rRNA (adenine2503-C2)-methyltransferase